MIRRRLISVSAFILIFAFFSTLSGITQETTGQENKTQLYERDDIYKQMELFSTALSYVLNNHYKDISKEKLEKVLSEAIRGMMEGLDDRYSFYQKETSRKQEQENLFYAKFGGLGIRILPSADGFVNIVQPMDGTPAMKIGLHAGDKILRVDGKSIENMPSDEVVNILRGEVGSKVTITILRQGREMPFDVTITRDIINFPSIKDAMIGDQIGYIGISNFTAETATELKTSIEKLKGKGMRAVIIDLRNNTGGMLSSAVDVSNAFIEEGVIVSTDGRLDKYDSEYRAKKENMLCSKDTPLVILINNGSASGSEIVAGAIKDYKRGLLMGEKTFGKGVVQQRFPLDENTAISITVSRYKTPNGTCIQEEKLFSLDMELQKDLDAGVVSESLQQTFSNNGITLSKGAVISTKDKDPYSSNKNKGIRWRIKDDQNFFAVKKEEGKLNVYEGGIEPDIEVEQPNLLENEDTKMLTKLYEGEYVNKFVYDYLDKHPTQNPEEQLKSLIGKVPELMKTLTDNGITLNEKTVILYIKSTFAGTRPEPRIDLETDLQLAKAVEEIKKLIH